MANYDFNEDIIIGEAGEQIIVNDLTKMGAKFIQFNKDNKYDLSMNVNGEIITYEIKTDVFIRPENDTMNMFIEKECRGKSSGIEVTQAKWFVTYFKHIHEVWYIKTETLKELIAKNNFKITSNSGDHNSKTSGYLIPRLDFKKHFIIRAIPR